MTRYAMAIDLRTCIGCYNCQIACKDEHVGNEFMPITQSQPTFGHFWRGIDEIEREISPSKIKVDYIPTLCQHCEDAPCIKEAKEEADDQPHQRSLQHCADDDRHVHDGDRDPQDEGDEPQPGGSQQDGDGTHHPSNYDLTN